MLRRLFGCPCVNSTHCSFRLTVETMYPALSQAELNEDGFVRLAHEGLFLYAQSGISIIVFSSQKDRCIDS